MKKYKIKVPESKPIYNIGEINALKKDFSYPVVVKGKYYDAYIANNEEQVRTYFNKISSKWGLPL